MGGCGRWSVGNYQSNRTARGHRRRARVIRRMRFLAQFRRTLRRNVFALLLRRVQKTMTVRVVACG